MAQHVRRFTNGLLILEPKQYSDDRGFFCELTKKSTLAELGITQELVQSNFSVSQRGVLRGLHYQKEPYAQAKLVTCLLGAIWDVVVDIRPESTTYMQWFSFYLTAKSLRQLWIPEGFLHGFYALCDINHVMYQTSTEYHAQAEVSIAYDSELWQIPWPREKILSLKDAHAPKGNWDSFR